MNKKIKAMLYILFWPLLLCKLIVFFDEKYNFLKL